MKRIYITFFSLVLCLLLVACAASRSRFEFVPAVDERMAAVIEVENTDRSYIEVPEVTTAVTKPTYFEVVAARTTEATTTETEVTTTAKPIEYFTVKFVDMDGYSTISVQNVKKGESARAPAVPDYRDGMVFLGWDKNFTNVQSGLIVKAMYQKEWLTVRFLDADGTVIKIEEVMYGGSATAPYVPDKGEYFFDGWKGIYEKVYRDVDIYATYYKIPERKFITLPDTFRMLGSSSDTSNIPQGVYFKKEYDGICSFGNEDYGGNIIHGNFCETIDITGFGFTSLEGMLGLKAKSENDRNEYSLRMYVYLDGTLAYSTQFAKNGVYKSFKIDIRGANKLTIRLEQYADGRIYYGDGGFVGGLIETVLYEN